MKMPIKKGSFSLTKPDVIKGIKKEAPGGGAFGKISAPSKSNGNRKLAPGGRK